MALPQRNAGQFLINIITRAEDQVARRLRNWLAGNGRESLSARNREVNSIKAILAELDKLVPTAAYTLVRHEFDNANKGLPFIREVDALPIRFDMSGINEEAVQLLADNMVHRLGDATQTLGRRVDDVFRRHGLRAAAAAVVHQGQNPDGLQAIAFRKQLEREGLTAFEDRLGRRWQLSTYAEMVIETTTSEARQRAVMNNMVARNLDLVKVDKHEHKSDVCSEFDGNTYSLTGKAQGYPVLKKVPPFHPRCKHYLMPDKLAFREREEREARESLGRDRAAA